MTPYYERDGITIFNADCRELLATMPAGSVPTGVVVVELEDMGDC